MKDIKKMLKAQAKDVLPDEKLRESIKQELGYRAAEEAPVLARADGGSEQTKEKRKVMIPLVAIAVILLVLAIVLPLALPGSSPTVLPGGNKFAVITNADSFYAYGAASVGSLLASESDASPVRAMKDGAAREEKHIETVNRYMALVEGLLSEDAIETTAVEGNEEYRYGMKIGYTDLLGNAAHYTLYYNKHFLNANQKEEDEKEEEYAIEGVLVAEGRTYPVSGNYETESEEDETEGELFFRAYLDEARSSYIEVTQEYESEREDGEQEVEREYVYCRYENGRRIERTTVEYESEEGELELKLTIEQEDVRDELVFESAHRDGETVLLAEGKLSGEDVRFIVYIREGGYHYVFDDGSSSDHDRYDDDHDDDDRDDDDDDYDDDDDDDRPWRTRGSASV